MSGSFCILLKLSDLEIDFSESVLDIDSESYGSRVGLLWFFPRFSSRDRPSGLFGESLFKLHVELLMLPCFGERSLDLRPGDRRSRLEELPLEVVLECDLDLSSNIRRSPGDSLFKLQLLLLLLLEAPCTMAIASELSIFSNCFLLDLGLDCITVSHVSSNVCATSATASIKF